MIYKNNLYIKIPIFTYKNEFVNVSISFQLLSVGKYFFESHLKTTSYIHQTRQFRNVNSLKIT